MTGVPSSAVERVIVAEDSAPNRAVLALLLRRMGFEVLEFSDGKGAWDALQASGAGRAPAIAAVLSDLMMPEMDGLELLRRARNDAKLAAVPFVLITAVADKDYVFEAQSLRADGYVMKPVTFARLEAKLREIFPARAFPRSA